MLFVIIILALIVIGGLALLMYISYLLILVYLSLAGAVYVAAVASFLAILGDSQTGLPLIGGLAVGTLANFGLYVLFFGRGGGKTQSSTSTYNSTSAPRQSHGQETNILSGLFKSAFSEKPSHESIPLDRRKLTDPCRCGSGKPFIKCHGRPR